MAQNLRWSYSVIERIFDYRRVKRALGHFPVISSSVYYLMDGDSLWCFAEQDGIFYICAVDNNPSKGKEAKRTAIAAFHWMFANTNAEEIYAKIGKGNRKSSHMAILGGMTRVRVEDDNIYYRIAK